MSKQLNNIIAMKPSAQLYYQRALKAFDRQQMDKGIRYLKRGISLAWNNQDYYYGQIQLALMYQHAGRFEDSIALIEELMQEQPASYPDLYYFQAVNLSYLNRFEEALDYLQEFKDILRQNKFMTSQYLEEAERMVEMINQQL
ncbi:hypothetical protein [Dolosigranulum savutiense]|uniref:Tetratricopeptide repeat protein n=1 Tax=Dolosigranulum savutiense TaxID=3110288 RepID=A0AB74TZ29_9LACT